MLSKPPTMKNSSKRTLPIATRPDSAKDEEELAETTKRSLAKLPVRPFELDNLSEADSSLVIMDETFSRTMHSLEASKHKLKHAIFKKQKKIKKSQSVFLNKLHSLSPVRSNPGLFERIDRLKIRAEANMLKPEGSERTPTMASGVERHSYLDYISYKNGLAARRLERRKNVLLRLVGAF